MSVEVKFRFEDDEWVALTEIAEEQGIRVGALVTREVTESARRLLRVRLDEQQAARRDRRIRELHAEGLSDRRIGLAVHLSHTAVRKHRQRLLLPNNHEPSTSGQRPVRRLAA